MTGFTTKAIHTPFLKKDTHGSLRMPVYDTAAFEFETAEEIESAFLGRKASHTYSRITNPTVEHLEQQIKNVTNAFAVCAVASGMAAISNLIMSITGQGDNIITSKHIFGNTYSLFEKTFVPFGLEIRYADFSDPITINKLIDKKTRAIFFETITNPQLEVADVKALSKITREYKVLLIGDTTVTPLYLFKSRDFGVDIEVISGTKYISGGATTVGGVIIDNGTYDWSYNPKLKADAKKYGQFTLVSKLKREVCRNTGACLSPHNAYLQSLGMETLALRIERSSANALYLAEFMSKHSKILRVNYPGLLDSQFYTIALLQFNGYFGALLTFDLGSKETCFSFLNRLKLIRRATNINDNKTLALHPASTIFCEYSPELKSEMGISENMIRLSVGIEDKEDLAVDINQALS